MSEEKTIPTETEKKPEERDEKGRFVNYKGPGAPLKADSWRAIESEILGASEVTSTITLKKINEDGTEEIKTQSFTASVGDKKTIRHAISNKKIMLALGGDMDAIKDSQNRDMGLPVQFIEQKIESDNSEYTYDLNGKSPDELRTIRDTLRKLRETPTNL
jgi:hypothetical protein